MPDYETFIGRDEARRAHALNEAILSDCTGQSDGELLARAYAFEGYLSGKTFTLGLNKAGDERGPVQIQAKKRVDGEEVPLPRPSHLLLDAGGNCLGCAWVTLERKIANAKG